MESKVFDLNTGALTPSDARDLVSSLFNSKINFLKLKILSITEGDHKADVRQLREKVSQLESNRKHILGLLEKAQNQGASIDLNNSLEIKLSERQELYVEQKRAV